MTAQAPSQSSPWPSIGMRRGALLVLLLLLAALFLLSLSLGSVSIPLRQIAIVLLGGAAEKATWTNIVLQFRLPKALTAALAGAALAVSGLQMQTLFRNPLAGPFVLGINSGASLGVALVILAIGAPGATLMAGISLLADFTIAAAAILGAAAIMLVILVVAPRVETTTLLILGLMVGYATSALVSVLLYFSIAERIQAYISWTFGSFGGVTWAQMRIMGPVILAGLSIAWLSAKPLNALLLGEGYARTLGLTVRRARFWIITSASILAGVVTAFAGPIGFIGVAVPHLCRGILRSSDHRVLVPGTILVGAISALAADLLAQLPGSQTILPLNAVTALLGAPVVTWVILRQRRLSASFGS